MNVIGRSSAVPVIRGAFSEHQKGKISASSNKSSHGTLASSPTSLKAWAVKTLLPGFGPLAVRYRSTAVCNSKTTNLKVDINSKEPTQVRITLTNMYTDPGTCWPPPDPDRMGRIARTFDQSQAFTQSMDVGDFRKRQEADQLRYQRPNGSSSTLLQRRQPFHVRHDREDSTDCAVYTDDDHDDEQSGDDDPAEEGEGEEGWRNSEGERLGDFGVDEDAEFYDEEDEGPLAELMRRRRQATAKDQ